MVKHIRELDGFDPDRKMLLVVKDADCPGLPEFLVSQPYGTETALIRSVLYDWFLTHSKAGTLTTAVATALDGPGALTRAKRSAQARFQAHDALGEKRTDRSESTVLGTVQDSVVGEPKKAQAQAQPIPLPASSVRLETARDPESTGSIDAISQNEIDSLEIYDAIP